MGGGGNDTGVPSGLPLSETDGMPSLSGMSPTDAAAFMQNNKKASTIVLLSDGAVIDHFMLCIELAFWPTLEQASPEG